jgi:uroporphyrinogen-III synthase
LEKKSVKSLLYLGTDPGKWKNKRAQLIHYPVIEAVPRPLHDPHIAHCLSDFPFYTHLLLTSPLSVRVLCKSLRQLDLFSDLKNKWLGCLGKQTALALMQEGLYPALTSFQEDLEGLLENLRLLPLEDSYFFFPRSSLARLAPLTFFSARWIRYQACSFYDIHYRSPFPPPDLSTIDQIVFTSPSTVRGFLLLYSEIPSSIELLSKGEVTLEALDQVALFYNSPKRIISSLDADS